MRRFDLLDEFTTVCVPARAATRPMLSEPPRSRRWLAPVAAVGAVVLLLVL